MVIKQYIHTSAMMENYLPMMITRKIFFYSIKKNKNTKETITNRLENIRKKVDFAGSSSIHEYYYKRGYALRTLH